MTDLDDDDRKQLIKILGMLGSEHEGERAAAALKASTKIKSLGVTWEDLFDDAERSRWGFFDNMARKEKKPPGYYSKAAREKRSAEFLRNCKERDKRNEERRLAELENLYRDWEQLDDAIWKTADMVAGLNGFMANMEWPKPERHFAYMMINKVDKGWSSSEVSEIKAMLFRKNHPEFCIEQYASWRSRNRRGARKPRKRQAA